MFYVLGNHEPYRTTLESAVRKLRTFEEEAKFEYGARFKFLFRDRYDIDQNITVLGCTLWSAIQPQQATEVYARLTDFNKERGIQGWSLEEYSDEHFTDLKWLNTQVRSIQDREPHRQIVIATHHCPTTDPRATDPAHQGSSVGSAFVSDLSEENCWISPAVKLWVFGHTHYSCNFRDEATEKLVVSNQRGYMGMKQAKRNSKSFRSRIVEADDHEWRVIDVDRSVKHHDETPTTKDSITKATTPSEDQNQCHQHPKMPLLQRATNRVWGFLNLSPRSAT